MRNRDRDLLWDGEANIPHTVRYTELRADRFKGSWEDYLERDRPRARPLIQGAGLSLT